MIKLPFQKLVAILLSLFVFGANTLLRGLDPAKKIQQYNLEFYSTEEGLPQSSVLSMVQTEDGYLWLGTYEGLARFDGIEFKIFNKTNTSKMASNRIRCLLQDQNGNLWIGTSGGLLRYRGGAFKNYTTADGLADNYAVTLYEDSSGRLWVGTTDGLSCFENDLFTSYSLAHGLAHGYILSLVETNENELWIGTSGGGLFVLQDGKISSKKLPELSDAPVIRVLYKDKEGFIWIGTGGNGLGRTAAAPYKGPGNHKSDRVKKIDLSRQDIRAIYQDSRGTLWVGTNRHGLNVLRKGGSSFLHSKQGGLSFPIRSIIEDHEGSLWVGSRSGLIQLKDDKFIIYNSRQGLPVDSVRSVFQDRGGNTWLGTVNGGLVRFKNGRFKTFAEKEGLKNKHIWTISQGRDGSIYFGTYGGGLYRLKNDKIIKIYTTENGLANNVVRAVLADSKGRIWVGTNGGGVDVISRGKITNYNSKNNLSGDFVFSISEDKEGNIWIGNYGGSIDIFKDGEFKTYSGKDGLAGHAIWSIYPDEQGVTWIGTDGDGLLRFEKGKFSRFTVKDGLYSDLIFQVVADKQNNLWMNCNQGIFSIKKKDVEDFLKGKIDQIPHISFGKSEGIKSTECNGPAQPAGLCGRAGQLWFPTIRGVVVIDPGNIKINRIPPPVVIEALSAAEKTVYTYPSLPEGGIKLAPGENRVEIKYTGLSFVAPGRVRFKYKLEGFDKEWFDSGSRRRVFYTNVPPGNYTFRVIARNNDGVKNETGTALSFRLEPFFWQTIWFRILVVFMFAVLSYLVIGFISRHLTLIAFWKKKKYIASYEIDEQIGVGGMGIIYKVHSLMDKNKTYALKVMREEYMLDEVQKKRFKNESLLIDRIEHPNIVKIYERGEDNEKLYILMELLEGQTLAERYRDGLYPSIYQCVHIMRQAADILVALFREDVIHRDLKPENIMLVKQNGDPDFVKLLDFGIARVQTFTHLTETGHVVGTLPYMPPEVISEGILSPVVDIYSLGVIGYEMLTRRKPFINESAVEILKQIINDEAVKPIEINPLTPPLLNDLILKMLSKDPDDRPDAPRVLALMEQLTPTASMPKAPRGMGKG